ncbi:uncharacterized protein ASCRUDRAFT_77005 [Ascoidea rubescens DSM 1968]|uniref:Uncharacterized protein n=1 Tax=Ascoidea rubescens DSM 1968 TaxID=1344418 RepID=A0A1D2VD78_9ASCO|nr:hypothetical protein ASCRUDRAFT_77005 [Ascoidea rubescens DSM 1968]ODV59658.1 hypothetical protein ASCRUDRAFT_77005 [Ascoidea rubescens DSM 1968]
MQANTVDTVCQPIYQGNSQLGLHSSYMISPDSSNTTFLELLLQHYEVDYGYKKPGGYRCNHCPNPHTFSSLFHIIKHFDLINAKRPFKCKVQTCYASVLGFTTNKSCAKHYKNKHIGLIKKIGSTPTAINDSHYNYHLFDENIDFVHRFNNNFSYIDFYRKQDGFNYVDYDKYSVSHANASITPPVNEIQQLPRIVESSRSVSVQPQVFSQNQRAAETGQASHSQLQNYSQQQLPLSMPSSTSLAQYPQPLQSNASQQFYPRRLSTSNLLIPVLPNNQSNSNLAQLNSNINHPSNHNQLYTHSNQTSGLTASSHNNQPFILQSSNNSIANINNIGNINMSSNNLLQSNLPNRSNSGYVNYTNYSNYSNHSNRVNRSAHMQNSNVTNNYSGPTLPGFHELCRNINFNPNSNSNPIG